MAAKKLLIVFSGALITSLLIAIKVKACLPAAAEDFLIRQFFDREKELRLTSVIEISRTIILQCLEILIRWNHGIINAG